MRSVGEEDLLQASSEALQLALVELETETVRLEGTDGAVRMHRKAALFTTELYRRSDQESWRAKTRQHYEEASRRKAIGGACEAALEWARFEARFGEPSESYKIAFRASRRFADTPCAAEVTELAGLMSPFAPSAAELAAIAADPDQGDPSVTHPAVPATSAVVQRLVAIDTRERALGHIDAGVRPLLAEASGVSIVVLDPGHGGRDYGARAKSGLVEATLTLDIANRVRDELGARAKHLRVLLTREEDKMMALEDRVAYANSVAADLFVSIHFNDADEAVTHGGVTTYVLDTTNDVSALKLAARENGSSVADVTGMQAILARIERGSQARASRDLAARVQAGTLAGARMILADLPDRGIKSAGFYVLVGTTMPAVLLEASFLTEPREEAALATDAYRAALARGIAEGIVRYTQL